MQGDIPVNMQGFNLMVTEEPTLKMRVDNETGEQKIATNRDETQQFVVSVFAKRKPVEGGFAGKGEEIRVTLTADPGEGFAPGTYVQLVDATTRYWQNEIKGKVKSGLSFKAAGMTPVS